MLGPFYWAHNFASVIQLPYSIALRGVVPQLLIASLVVLCLFLAVLRKRAATLGFLIAAALAPVLSFIIGNVPTNVWPVSTALLLVLAWRYRSYLAAQA